MRLLASILILSFVYEIHGFGVNFWKMRSLLMKHSEQRHQMLHKTAMPNNVMEPVSGVILQPLDHFDPQIKTTYGQRYWVNSQYWKRPDGPVFLYVGGEGSLSPAAAEMGTYIDFAKKYGALVFAVEHRFYGLSMNKDGLELKNLQFLSSQQALADLATFHLYASKTYNLTKSNKWISFGGSYPGALSAWVRIKYPHLIHAAVASSAPVRAAVDFPGYNDVVAESLGTEIVGGSSKCVDMIRTAFQKVDELIKSKNLAQLASDFQSCGALQSELDVWQFVSNLADWFMGTVQYNNERPGDINIEAVCQTMTQSSDAYKNLIVLNKQFLQNSQQNCSDNSWQNFMNQLKNTTFDPTSGVGIRQWTYQTCSQFGYYQACDDDECIFSRYMTFPPNLDICLTVFNLSPQEVYNRIDFSNAYYGSDSPQGSRILFVNGLVDPWHALSVLSDVSPTEMAIVIPGTAHCADMHQDPIWDPPALKEARKKIGDQIGLWLAEDNSRNNKLQKPSLNDIVHRSFQKL